MRQRDTTRRLQALEARADQEITALYTSLVQSLSDEELDAYIAFLGVPEELHTLTDAELDDLVAQGRLAYQDYTRLQSWLKDRRAQIA